MSRKTINLVLMVGGLVLMVFGSYPGINWAQLTGAAVGLVALICGYWRGRSKVEGEK
jgi:O-antigen/teichoic acid export membrane protein